MADAFLDLRMLDRYKRQTNSALPQKNMSMYSKHRKAPLSFLFQFSFEIEEASLATIRSAVPRAVSASIGLVDSSDVRILGIEQHTVDHPPELELPPDIIYEVRLILSN